MFRFSLWAAVTTIAHEICEWNCLIWETIWEHLGELEDADFFWLLTLFTVKYKHDITSSSELSHKSTNCSYLLQKFNSCFKILVFKLLEIYYWWSGPPLAVLSTVMLTFAYNQGWYDCRVELGEIQLSETLAKYEERDGKVSFTALFISYQKDA